MGKLEPIDQKRTNWEGLWYHPDLHSFSSVAFSLSDLRKFKGNVRLIVKKNQYYNNGKNNRPNYIFMLVDSKSEKWIDLQVVDDDADSDDDEEYGFLV